ncbi:Putative oxoglutarate/iron-dependent dioxygenase, non-hem dioxygenase domain-containing protein [Septoria linicola]|uniref:Oxoglutarate/iron-dependent dioxygenase, non-hem dioxygenase domain-containing protein n=1 Tax=Septoria linicola TaxID=215465 RepID=A0A9Q9AQM3_9PEZI|nr:Putative oxoglutarate/iron-dependent dioxygenase, non-hem dioxygenase domain-containing protein [Septoria linicola]
MQPSAVSSAVSSDSLEIPLIDFSAFLQGDALTKRSTAQAILSGFQRAGFIYLKNHGIARDKVQGAFSQSAKFFERSEKQKLDLGWTTPRANRGYSQPGREKTTDATDPAEIEKIRAAEGADLKESFEIGREGVPDCPNQWPDSLDEDGKVFKGEMLEFFELVKGLHIEVMRAIAVGLDIEQDWFDSYTDGGDNTLRLLHYPAVKSEVFKDNKNTVRAGAHTDYGSITCLFQDMRGGLQVLSPNGNYIDATPIEDAIVVNAGDLLARWSNDTIKSTKHRVVEPPTTADVHPARYSIAYFCNPNFDRFIDAIPATYGEGKPKKYQGINSGDYLEQRLSATY